jgi:adenylate kinase family enzyme
MRRKDSAVTSSRTLIPISSIKFIDDIPRLRDVEERLKKFLRQRRLAVSEATEEDDPEPSDRISYHYEEIDESDGAKIKRRSMRYLQRVHSSIGIYHLSGQNAAKLNPLRGGLPVSRIANEHEADVIAAALHCEMPWMARATEEVWLGMRRSVRDDLPGVRFNPLVLNGPPGIGKSYWARRLAHHLAVPTTMIEATGEPATFSLVGTQRGWGSAAPGKLVLTVLCLSHLPLLSGYDEPRTLLSNNAIWTHKR